MFEPLVPDGAFWRGFNGGALLEEVCHWTQVFRTKDLTLLAICSLDFMLAVQDMGSQVPAPYLYACCLLPCLPTMMGSGSMRPDVSFFLYVVLAMVGFCLCVEWGGTVYLCLCLCTACMPGAKEARGKLGFLVTWMAGEVVNQNVGAEK